MSEVSLTQTVLQVNTRIENKDHLPTCATSTKPHCKRKDNLFRLFRIFAKFLFNLLGGLTLMFTTRKHLIDDFFFLSDINECVSQTGPCQRGQVCINTVGSYTCQRNSVNCGQGYHLNEEGTRCIGKGFKEVSASQNQPYQ